MGSQRVRHTWACTHVFSYSSILRTGRGACVSLVHRWCSERITWFSFSASQTGWNNIFQSCWVTVFTDCPPRLTVSRWPSEQLKEIPCHYSQEIGEPKQITSQTSHSWLAVELLLCLKPVLFKHPAPLSLHGVLKQRYIKAEGPSPGASDTHACHVQTSHLTQEE